MAELCNKNLALNPPQSKKNEQPKTKLLLLLSDLPQIFPLSSSSVLPHDPIFIDSIAIHFRIFCHNTRFKFISILHCDESLQ
jgi:hypothetical protein